MRVLRVLTLAGAVAAAAVGASTFARPAAALPGFARPAGRAGIAAEPVQAVCGPYRCFARPFWRYRSGAGFLPYRRFGFAPSPPRFAPPRFAPFGFRRFDGLGGFGGRPGGFRRF